MKSSNGTFSAVKWDDLEVFNIVLEANRVKIGEYYKADCDMVFEATYIGFTPAQLTELSNFLTTLK